MNSGTGTDGASPDSDFTIAPRKRDGRRDKPEDIPDHVLDVSSRFNLYVSDRVVIGVRQHVCLNPTRETGGVLLGRQYQRGEVTVVSVTGFAPLPSGSANAVHLDERSLLALHNRSYAPGEYVVGWFHSHPNMGDPFMSNHDVNLHRMYFNEPWYVSCVVGVGEWSVPLGFWRLDGSELIPIEEHYVHMTMAKPPAEQFRRLLRSCNSEDRSLMELFTLLRSVLADVGFDGGSIGQAVEVAAAKEAETDVARSKVGTPWSRLSA